MSEQNNVTVVQLMQQIAREGFDAWDEGHDMRAGKILKCMAGLNPGYRPDLDAALARDAEERRCEDLRREQPLIDLMALSLARSIAQQAHEGQRDKGGRPYIEHPSAVAARVARAGAALRGPAHARAGRGAAGAARAHRGGRGRPPRARRAPGGPRGARRGPRGAPSRRGSRGGGGWWLRRKWR